MIDKINHYSITNPSSVYDEEAMTALELAGRTSAKVNECVETVNDQDKEIADHKTYVEGRLDAQDKLIPVKVKTAVQDCIDDGSFDEAISEYAGELEARLDNLINSVPEGSTTMDAEVIDGRVDNFGTTRANLGSSVRAQIFDAFSLSTVCAMLGYSVELSVSYGEGDGVAYVKIGNEYIDLRKPNSSIIIEKIYLNGDQASEVADNITANDDGSYTVKLASHTGLVYNVHAKKLYIREQNRQQYGDVLLIANAFSRIFDGFLMKEYLVKQIEALKASDDTANNRVTNLFRSLTWFFYVGYGDRSKVKTEIEAGTGAMIVQLPINLNYLSSQGNGNVTLSESTISEYTFANYVDEINSEYVRVKIPANTALIYDRASGKIGVNTLNQITDRMVILLINNFGLLSEGCLLPFIHDQRIGTLEARVTNVETMGTGNPAISSFSSVERFAGKIATASDYSETFIFATDPHLCHGDDWQTKFDQYMTYLKNVFDATPTSLVIFGGDWLSWNDTATDACIKLGYVDGQLRKLFGDRYISVIGNHDTNYQGDSRLDEDVLSLLWQREHGRTYFTHETRTTKFICLDTDVDWSSGWVEEYFDRQRVFLRDELMNTDKHVVIVEHMHKTNETEINPLAQDVLNVCTAYNARGEVRFGTQSVSFANAVGYVDVILTGHHHKDDLIYTDYESAPAIVITADMQNGNVPTFDLALIDYTERKLHLVREGTGNDRDVVLIGGGETGSLPDNTPTDSALPHAVLTDGEMTALLESGEVGGVYKFVGESTTYENGALYVLEVSE